MSDETDDMKPVTRGELREELAVVEARFDQKLELWGGAILARVENSEKRMVAEIAKREQRTLAEIAKSEQRVLGELARHTKSIEESLAVRVSVVDEKYDDVPEQRAAGKTKQVELETRVVRLETAVFPPSPEPKRRARRRG